MTTKRGQERDAAAADVVVWHVYAVRCIDDALYLGMTNDLAARIAAHEEGRGARFTRGRAPLALVWSWTCPSSSYARRLEGLLKRLRKPARERLVRDDVDVLAPILREVERRIVAAR